MLLTDSRLINFEEVLGRFCQKSQFFCSRTRAESDCSSISSALSSHASTQAQQLLHLDGFNVIERNPESFL